MKIRMTQIARIGAAVLVLGALDACKGFLEVKNPGPIQDSQLEALTAVPGFVAGMSGDLSDALDEIVRIAGIGSDDLNHGGSYSGEGLWVRGIIHREDINSQWALMQKARWTAESGITRIKPLLAANYDTDSLAARANLLAGFANRLLGENVCSTTIDGGPEEANAVHFARAEAYFTEAIRIANSKPFLSLVRAAYSGRADVRAWQGNWAGAIADAALVPTNFTYVAFYSTNSGRENNSLVQETYVRREFTVFGTQWATVFNDPRVGWDTIYTSATKTAIQKGQDGKTNFFRQKKYPDLGADIPLAKGAEALMIRAEERLIANDVPGAWVFVNQQRANYSMAALPTPATVAAAWPIFEKERGAVTWLEARRLWDLRRWNADTGPAHSTFLDTRDKCIPISLEERQVNPNLTP
jgi:starch-binding outer membrane protein, SusD/RagB family